MCGIRGSDSDSPKMSFKLAPSWLRLVGSELFLEMPKCFDGDLDRRDIVQVC